MPMVAMSDLDLHNERVTIREDFNVPMQNGQITSDARLVAALPTIRAAHEAGAIVILLSHLGRPEEGTPPDPDSSLKPVATRLAELLNLPVKFVPDWLDGGLDNLQPGDIALCENVRLNKGEKKNADELSQRMAGLCDIFVMDAFASAHRAEASTHGIAKFAPMACAGPLLLRELEALGKALQNPRRPLIAIVGGSKVSSKLILLKSLLNQVNQLIVGGGIANTFLKAAGFPVGKSLYEPELIAEAKELLDQAKARNVLLHLPVDVVTATEFSATATARQTDIQHVRDDEMILDIGVKTAANHVSALQQAGTIIWNGPVGVFEFPAFSQGTRALAFAIAESPAFSLAGGGDTLAAIEKFNIADKISYISTGGGAFLEFIEGKILPAVEILEMRGKNFHDR